MASRVDAGRRVSLQRAFLAAIAFALVIGIVPVGIALHQRLAVELETKVREALATAPPLLADRSAAVADAMMMHAKELSQTPGLADALARGDRQEAAQLVAGAAAGWGDEVILVEADGWRRGPAPGEDLLAATKRGDMPVAVVAEGDRLLTIALAPVQRGDGWLGAVGFATVMDETAATTLAGLTRSDIVIAGRGDAIAATTLEPSVATALIAAAHELPHDVVSKVTGVDRSFLVTQAPLGGAGKVIFAKDLARELAVLPSVRRVIVLSGIVALALGLGLGGVLAAVLARPVRALAQAADRLSEGDFTAPIRESTIREVDRLAQAFNGMRRALAARLADLEDANRLLAERQAKLKSLQSELIRRDRLAATSRLVAELAHEIRNPVASLRNCLEIIHRRLDDDPKGQEFASVAIEELLRMHELAEQMLDLNRPRSTGEERCDIGEVAQEVAGLVQTGAAPAELVLEVAGGGRAAIPPDALKQVLLNLVQNAREAKPANLRLRIEIRETDALVSILVEDNGPGIAPEILPHVFDPFFTTKGSVHGTGLGLFVAEGIVRRFGGKITAENRADGAGARFCIELVSAPSKRISPPGGVGSSALGREEAS